MEPPGADLPIRILRIIARLNIGGPAIQVISLTRLLNPLGYQTVLLRGRESPTEGTMDHLAGQLGVVPTQVPGLKRGVGLHDLRALISIVRWIGRARPDVLHTHTAKAGSLGRLAAVLVPKSRRPRVVVHTFHGHVLRGEFSPRMSRRIARIERLLARRSSRLIAVSPEIKSDLVEFGVAAPDKIEVVRLGFDLAPFTIEGEARVAIRATARQRLGLQPNARVITVIARVVKVKRIDRFLAMATRLADVPDIRFLVAGDGDLRKALSESPDARALGEKLVWVGFQRDVASICFASDVVVLTSDNEGTPVCLIEAQAAGLPVVSTGVGGVRTVVQHGRSGTVVDSDPDALAKGVRGYLQDPELARSHGREGRRHVLEGFSIDRLVRDIDQLYRRLIAEADANRRLV